MKLLGTFSFAVLALCLTTRTAHAQASIYGLYGVTNYGAYSYPGESQLDYPNASAGFGGGLTYVFYNQTVSVGVDLRDIDAPRLGNNNTSDRDGNTAALMARVGFVPPAYRCHPYFEIGPALISENVDAFPGGYGARSIHTAAYSVDFGLDVRVSPFLDIRAADLQVAVGGSGTNAAESVAFGFGVVFHLPHTR